jgi:hypothetical protein
LPIAPTNQQWRPIADFCYGSTVLKPSKTCDITIVSIIWPNCRSWQDNKAEHLLGALGYETILNKRMGIDHRSVNRIASDELAFGI